MAEEKANTGLEHALIRVRFDSNQPIDKKIVRYVSRRGLRKVRVIESSGASLGTNKGVFVEVTDSRASRSDSTQVGRG